MYAVFEWICILPKHSNNLKMDFEIILARSLNNNANKEHIISYKYTTISL